MVYYALHVSPNAPLCCAAAMQGPGPTLGPKFIVGAIILTASLVVFNSDSIRAALERRKGMGYGA